MRSRRRGRSVFAVGRGQFLQDEGFITIEADNGEHASTVVGSHPHIHVLFTDVHLRGAFNGVQLAHLARKRWPSIAILIVSGRGQPTEEEMPSDSRFHRRRVLPSPNPLPEAGPGMGDVGAPTRPQPNEGEPVATEIDE